MNNIDQSVSSVAGRFNKLEKIWVTSGPNKGEEGYIQQLMNNGAWVRFCGLPYQTYVDYSRMASMEEAPNE